MGAASWSARLAFTFCLIHRAGLLRALQEEGFVVVAAAPEGKGAEELRQMGVRTEVLPFEPTGMSPIGDLVVLHRFRTLMKRIKPVAFIAFTVKPNIYGSVAARMAGVPSLNNISGLGRVFVARTVLTRLVERLYRWGLKRSCSVFFFENRDDEQLFLARKIVRPDQAVALPGAGLDLEQFAPVDRARAEGKPFTFLLAAPTPLAQGRPRVRRSGSCCPRRSSEQSVPDPWVRGAAGARFGAGT